VVVVDASAVVELLLAGPTGLRIGARLAAAGVDTAAPHLLDVEVVSAFRRLAREGTVSPERAGQAIEDLAGLRIVRHPHGLLLPRIWDLRHVLSAYDATYVALAEALDGVLWTRDVRLARAPGLGRRIELV
jgi:predicted nucleic acid-binding protein